MSLGGRKLFKSRFPCREQHLRSWGLLLGTTIILVTSVFRYFFSDREATIWEEKHAEDNMRKYPADPDVPTFALEVPLMGGLRNQCMAFTFFVISIMGERLSDNEESTPKYQILLPSISFIDFLGTDRRVPFERLFDVRHWNSFYPTLPKLVSYDPRLHTDWDNRKKSFRVSRRNRMNHTSDHPIAFPGLPEDLFRGFVEYAAEVRKPTSSEEIHPVDRLVKKGALRPHPTVMNYVTNFLIQKGDFMALHARVEPDFVWVNNPRRILNLTTVFSQMEQYFTDPPASRCFIAINRPLLEKTWNTQFSLRDRREYPDSLRRYNLIALNRASRDGLWGGRVQVFERPPLRGTHFADRALLFAAMIDSTVATQATVFVGSMMSSFAVDVVQKRVQLNNTANFLYQLEGIEHINIKNPDKPPSFIGHKYVPPD